jgi:hypothetical protein
MKTLLYRLNFQKIIDNSVAPLAFNSLEDAQHYLNQTIPAYLRASYVAVPQQSQPKENKK